MKKKTPFRKKGACRRLLSYMMPYCPLCGVPDNEDYGESKD